MLLGCYGPVVETGGAGLILELAGGRALKRCIERGGDRKPALLRLWRTRRAGWKSEGRGVAIPRWEKGGVPVDVVFVGICCHL